MSVMFNLLRVQYAEWSGHLQTPGQANIRRRSGVVNHHPSPHAVKAGAGMGVEVRELRAIDRYHRSRGWGSIGYHFVVSQSGRIYIARGWERTGAHAPNHNSTMYGLAWLLDGRTEVPTAAAFEAMSALIGEGISKGLLTHNYRVLMHSDVSPTSCPGGKLLLALREWKWPHQTAQPPLVAPRRVLREGMSGEDVRQVQRALELEVRHRTGFFGPITASAVRQFQARVQLDVDGIVGPATYKALYGE